MKLVTTVLAASFLAACGNLQTVRSTPSVTVHTASDANVASSPAAQAASQAHAEAFPQASDANNAYTSNLANETLWPTTGAISCHLTLGHGDIDYTVVAAATTRTVHAVVYDHTVGTDPFDAHVTYDLQALAQTSDINAASNAVWANVVFDIAVGQNPEAITYGMVFDISTWTLSVFERDTRSDASAPMVNVLQVTDCTYSAK